MLGRSITLTCVEKMNAFMGNVAMDPHAMHQIARPLSLTESAGSILYRNGL